MKESTLRYIRNALELTQTQLGELLGVTYATGKSLGEWRT